jgi:chemotaxis signal transduction protein
MTVSDAPSSRAAELRDAFDRSFTQAPSPEAGAVENLLAIRLGANPYALRLSDVSGLFADKNTTWLPSPVPELLGMAGIRGTVLPVYDLGMLLGCPRAAAPRWLVVAAGAPVALAFEAFDGYMSVRAGGIEQQVQTVIDLHSILEQIRNRCGHGGDSAALTEERT